MSLLPETEVELKLLAEKITREGKAFMEYGSFGILIQKDSPEFENFKDNIVLGEIFYEKRVFLYIVI